MKKIIEKIKLFWDKLPKEIKVAVYISASYGLADLITLMKEIKIDNSYLAIVFNMLLVFLVELKPRIERLKKNP